MYDDYPEEAKGLKYFLTMVTIATIGLVAWIVVAKPMGGDASATTDLAVAAHE
jgi:hypothetical protein